MEIFYDEIRKSLEKNFKAVSEILNDQQIEHWQRALDDHSDQRLSKRLAWDADSLLEMDSSSKSFDTPPYAEWNVALEQLLCRIADRPVTKDGDFYIIEQAWMGRVGVKPFEDLWYNAAFWLVNKLRSNISNDIHSQFHDAVWSDIGSQLIVRLAYICERVLWQSFNSLRPSKILVESHFCRQSDEEHLSCEFYETFIKDCQNSKLENIFDKHPVLRRLLGVTTKFWFDANKTLLKRIANDRYKIEETFSIPSDWICSKINFDAGDSHNNFQSVGILVFSGSCKDEYDKKLVFKPRCLKLDNAFQELLHNGTETGRYVALKSIKVMCCDSYGYLEYVEHCACQSQKELQEFYRNAGRLLAVLYLLGCSDCHYENLIANGSQLHLIDTETLFETHVIDHIRSASLSPWPESDTEKMVIESVLRTGLLPHWTFIGTTKTAIDISALGVDTSNAGFVETFGWKYLNTDGMMPAKVKVKKMVATSLPVGLGEKNPFLNFLNEFCAGFVDQLTWISKNRDSWLDPGGLLDSFVNLNRRIVTRPTRVYYGIQQQQLEPEALTSSFRQAMKLELLSRSYVIADNKPKHFLVLESEIRQMLNLDIPYFEQRIDSSELPLKNGLPPVIDYSEGSGIRDCRLRLNSLSEDTIQQQVLIINGVAKAKNLRVNTRGLTRSKPKQLDSIVAVKQTSESVESAGNTNLEFLRNTEAERIARIVKEAALINTTNVPEWLGMDVGSDSERYYFGLIGKSLYSGDLGIAVFFSTMGKEYLEIARKIMAPVVEMASNANHDTIRRWWRDQPKGLMAGAGTLLALQEMAKLDPISANLYQSTEDRLIKVLSYGPFFPDYQIDILEGLSGLIGPLLKRGSQVSIEYATKIGLHIADIQRSDGGWQGKSGQRPLTGFSHGAAGISAAMGVLGMQVNSDRILSSAQRGLMYERNVFDSTRCNWPDFRFSSDGNSFASSWCHGAPGIALSRMCLLETPLGDESLKEELEIAFETTALNNCRVDHLCCGRFGRSSILTLGGRTHDANILENDTLVSVSSNVDEYALTAAVDDQLILPGLFTGLSGIGLALNSPETLSSILSSGLYEVKVSSG